MGFEQQQHDAVEQVEQHIRCVVAENDATLSGMREQHLKDLKKLDGDLDSERARKMAKLEERNRRRREAKLAEAEQVGTQSDVDKAIEDLDAELAEDEIQLEAQLAENEVKVKDKKISQILADETDAIDQMHTVVDEKVTQANQALEKAEIDLKKLRLQHETDSAG